MYKVDNKDTKATSFDVFLVSLLLTLNTKHMQLQRICAVQNTMIHFIPDGKDL